MSLEEKVQKILENSPEARPSYFQLKYFVLGKEPTIQSQMWACLRELKSRFQRMRSLELEIEEYEDKFDLLDLTEKKDELELDRTLDAEMRAIKESELAIKKRSIGRQKRSINYELVDLKEKLKFTEQEMNFIVQYFEALEKVEPIKDFDDLEVQRKYWNEKFTEEINLRILLKQPINIGLAKEILSLNDDAPIKVDFTNFLEKHKNPIEGILEKGSENQEI